MVNKATRFRFSTSLHLLGLTDYSASDLPTLNTLIKKASDASIFFHTHHFRPNSQGGFETDNDFALWLTTALHEQILAEQLSAIDVGHCGTIADLRQEMLRVIKCHMLARGDIMHAAPPGNEFHLIDPVTFILPTDHTATTLREFAICLGNVSTNSIAYHLFEAGLRFGDETRTFSFWLRQIGEEQLADRIEKINVNNYPSLADIQARLVFLTKKRIREHECEKS